MRFENYRWLLIPVTAIHNLEEWATFPSYGSISPALAARGVVPLAQPSWRVMEIGWVLATLLPAGLVIAGARASHSRLLDVLVCWVAAIYLANALLPHAGEFLIGARYAPGVATALLVNLPFCSLMLRQAARENVVTRRELVAIVAAGFVSMIPVLFAVFWLASEVAYGLGRS